MRPSRRGVVHAPYLLYGCSRWIGERGLRLGSSHSSTAHKDIWRSPSSAGFDPPCPTGGRVWAFGGAGSREDNGDPHALRAHKADQRRMQRAGVFPGKGPGGRPCRVRCDACKRQAIRPYDGPAEFAVFRTGGGHGGKSRQKLSLARALVNYPSVLLLDEPTSGLDYESAHALHALVSQFAAREDTTVLLGTSMMHYAQSICTAYGILEGGELVASGDFQSLSLIHI